MDTITNTNTISLAEEMALHARFEQRHAPKRAKIQKDDTRRCATCQRLISEQDNGYCPGCRAEGQDFAY